MAEVMYLYSIIGDDNLISEQTIFPGLIIAKTNQNTFESIKKLRILIENDPLILRFVLKIIPIDEIVESSQEKIIEKAKELSEGISETETFRISIKTRYTMLDSRDLVIKVADLIDRKVNLTKPDKILMIQILGQITGISLLRPNDILSKAEFS